MNFVSLPKDDPNDLINGAGKSCTKNFQILLVGFAVGVQISFGVLGLPRARGKHYPEISRINLAIGVEVESSGLLGSIRMRDFD